MVKKKKGFNGQIRDMDGKRISPIVREMQIKPQWDTTTKLPEWLISKRLTMPCFGEGVEQLDQLYIAGGS